jgi:hypothetical protein
MTHDATADLGPLVDRYRPSAANMGAGIILGLLMAGGGVALAGFAVRGAMTFPGPLPLMAEIGHSWFSVVIMTLLGIGLVAGGIFLIQFVRSTSSLRIDLYERALIVTRAGTPQIIRWEDLAAVKETHLHEHLPLVKGPLKAAMPTRMNKSVELTFRDGSILTMDGNNVERLNVCIAKLQGFARRHDVPWTVVEETG